MNRRDLIKSVGSAFAVAMTPRGRAMIGLFGGGSTSQASKNLMGLVFSAGGTSSLSYENLPIFKNRVREGRGFTTYSTGTPSEIVTTLNAQGWPTTDFTCFLWEGSVIPSWVSAATSSTPFKCGFIGSGSETITALLNCTIANIVHGTGGAYTTFDLYNCTGDFGFNVTGTSGAVTNVFAYLPAYPGSAIDDPTQASAYTTEAINHYSQFHHINWESFQSSANNSFVCTSADRHSASNTQSRRQHTVPTAMALSAAPASGAVSGQFTANWLLPSGQYGLPMGSAGNTCGRVCTMTNGSPNFTFSPALTEAVNVTYIPNTQPGMEGYPVEWMIALSKAAKVGLWLHAPLLEDGTNYSAGSYMSAVFDLLNSSWDWTLPVYIETSLEIWNYWSSFFKGVATTSGFADIYSYMAYRLHAMATLGRTKFGSKWGNQVQQVFAWQTGANGLSMFKNTLADMQSSYGSPSADISYLAIAPYCTPSVGNTDTVATIEGYITNGQGTSGSDGPRQALRTSSENIAALAMSYGLSLVAYEDGIQWNSVNQNNANVGAAIMDSGITSAIEVYYNGFFNSPYVLATHTAGGVSSGNGNAAPEDELTNNYASLSSSPTLLALQQYMNGFTPTRNVVSGAGATTDCINYADNDSTINATYPYLGQLSAFATGPHYGTSGYITYTVWSPSSQTRSLELTLNAAASGATDVEVNGTVLYSNVTFTSATTVALGSVSLNAGWNYLTLGRSGVTQSTVVPKTLTWN